MSVFKLISFVNAEKNMQKPLTVTECKWMLIWGLILPHFQGVWELSHHVLYTIGIVSLLQLDFLHLPQKLKGKWICLNYYGRIAKEMDVNEFYSVWGKTLHNHLLSLKIPVHTSKFNLHVRVQTHTHSKHIQSIVNVLLLPTNRCSPGSSPMEFYTICFL